MSAMGPYCEDCLALSEQNTTEPHRALAKLHVPDGTGWSIYSCSACGCVFVQYVLLGNAAPLRRCDPQKKPFG